MRILYLTNVPSPYRVAFFNALGRQCDLTVLYERRSSKERDPSWSSVQATTFKERYLTGLHYGPNKSLAPSVVKHLADRNYDVVVVGGYATPTGALAILTLKILGRPYVLNVDGPLRAASAQSARSHIKRLFIGGAEGYLATGREAAESLIRFGAESTHVHVYPFSSVSAKDIPKSLSPAYQSPSAPFRVLAVGQFIHRKGFDVLLRSAALLGNRYEFQIIGGNETEEYARLRESLGLRNVEFAPFKSPAELRKDYRSADVFVLPTREDVWGLVVNEAMAQGVPVITTSACGAGVEMVIQGGNGYLIEPDSARALADAIRRVERGLSAGPALREGALRTARRYTIESMAEAHMTILRDIIEARLS